MWRINETWFNESTNADKVQFWNNFVDEWERKETRMEGLIANLTKDVEGNTKTTGVQGKNMDAFFLFINAVVVVLLQAGFAFLECGAVRSKNATNILIKNILDALFGAVAYFVFGFAFAYGNEEHTNSFIGYWHFAGYEMDGRWGEWFFQFVFAATASTIVSGAVAERCSFTAYFIYSLFITGFVYPVVSHWGWTSEGFLYAAGYRDFAGSGLVHLTGGVAALCGAVLMGPRLGRFDYGLFDLKKEDAMKGGKLEGHSVPLAALGGLLLLVGFFSFNGGSQLAISNEGDGEVVSLVVSNTIMAGAASGIVALVVNRISFKGQPTGKWSILTTINATLAGMVSICCSCDKVYPWAAMVIGAGAGPIMMATSWTLQKLHVDDPLDAFAVHGGGGIWGLLIMPFLRKDTGLFYGNPDVAEGDVKSDLMLGMSVAGILVIVVWTGGLSVLMFGGLRLLGLLRVDQQTEIMGMDIVKHGEPAYPTAAYGGDMKAVSRRMSQGGILVGNSVPIIAPNPNIFNEFKTGKIGNSSSENGNESNGDAGRDNEAYL